MVGDWGRMDMGEFALKHAGRLEDRIQPVAILGGLGGIVGLAPGIGSIGRSIDEVVNGGLKRVLVLRNVRQCTISLNQENKLTSRLP